MTDTRTITREQLAGAWIEQLGDHHEGCLPPVGDCPVGAEVANLIPRIFDALPATPPLDVERLARALPKGSAYLYSGPDTVVSIEQGRLLVARDIAAAYNEPAGGLSTMTVRRHQMFKPWATPVTHPGWAIIALILHRAMRATGYRWGGHATHTAWMRATRP